MPDITQVWIRHVVGSFVAVVRQRPFTIKRKCNATMCTEVSYGFIMQHIMDVAHTDVIGEAIGRRIVLPSRFTGGERYYRRRFQDSLAIVRKFGKPDFFITFTCNPDWPEIVEELAPGQKANDRPDICVRVFKQKLDKLIKALKDHKLLGEVSAHVHVVEFQKRGTMTLTVYDDIEYMERFEIY